MEQVSLKKWAREWLQIELVSEFWVYNGQFGRRFGTSAEYITLPEEQAVFLPDEASFEVGACMAIPAMTAHQMCHIRWKYSG